MKVTFWGTRGSIANASTQTLHFGGNTSCVEVRTDAGTLLVLDCGTGGFPLGQAITSSSKYPDSGHLLISHTHWDHIQGIPFFAPLFRKGKHWNIYAPHGLTQSLQDTLSGQMNYTYSPISLSDMDADIEYQDLVEGVLVIDDVKITTQFLNHPSLTLGYRIEADNAVVVYACDHEPVSRKGIPDKTDMQDREARHIDFLRGASLVIHDAQYTADEYESKIGWGHSTVEYAVAVCVEAGVRQLALTHHDPLRSDQQIASIVDDVKSRLRKAGSQLDVLAAAEHLTLEIAPDPRTKASPDSWAFPAQGTERAATSQHSLMMGTLHANAAKVVRAAAKAEGIPMQTVNSNNEKSGTGYAVSASMIIVDTHTPHEEINEILAIVKSQKEHESPVIPVIAITYDDQAEISELEISTIATDGMIWPFSEQYARTKFRSWILRYNCRWERAKPPSNEPARISNLHSLNILHTESEERFDRITRLAAETLEVPIALISLVDSETQWFKSCIGLDADETSREVAFCAHAILEDGILIVPDTLLDNRFADNPLVTEAPNIRFYAGCPIRSSENFALGTLCLIDTRPRQLNGRQLNILKELASIVEGEINQGSV